MASELSINCDQKYKYKYKYKYKWVGIEEGL